MGSQPTRDRADGLNAWVKDPPYGLSCGSCRAGHLIASAILVLLLTSARLPALSFQYCITTDKSAYRVGEQVHWTLYAAVSNDNDGIESFRVSIRESKHENMASPLCREILAAPKEYK